MRREDKKKIIQKRRQIVNHLLDLEGVLDYLITKQVFTPAIRERILYEFRVPRDRVRQTLDYLVTTGPTSFKIFLEGLILTGNVHLVRELDPDYVDSEDCKNLIENEGKLSIEETPNIYEAYYRGAGDQEFLTSSILSPKGHSTRSIRTKSQSPASLITRRGNSKTPEQTRSTLISQQQSSFSANVAPHQFRTSPYLTGLQNIARSRSSSRSHVINYTTNDSISMIPSQELTWNDINNLDLDFEVLSNGLSDFTDDIFKNQEDCYPMDIEPRGVCLIINNEHFYDHDKNELIDLRRCGTDMDACRMKNLFQQLKFHVKFEIDLTVKEITETIKELARDCKTYSHDYQAICLIILSHGSDGYIYGSDYDNKINMDTDILNLFDDVLHNKPKLFIFQACRGENINQKLQTISNVEETISKFKDMKVNHTPPLPPSSIKNKKNSNQIEPSTSNNLQKTSSLNNFIDSRPIRTTLPSRSDFFIWYSSVRGFVSHRDVNGSPFIKCLVAVFSRFSKCLELVEMVRKVNFLMQQYERIHSNELNSVSSYFMLPAPEYHLTKRLYFNP